MNIKGWLITALLFHFVMFDWLTLSWFTAFLFWKSGCAQTAGCSFARLKKLNIDSAPHTTTPRGWLQSPAGLDFLSPLIFIQAFQVKRGIQNCVNNQFNQSSYCCPWGKNFQLSHKCSPAHFIVVYSVAMEMLSKAERLTTPTVTVSLSLVGLWPYPAAYVLE